MKRGLRMELRRGTRWTLGRVALAWRALAWDAGYPLERSGARHSGSSAAIRSV